MKIVSKKIDSIKPYEKNARVHDESQVRAIANSITEFGFKQPILVDADGVIISGHGRYEAAKMLGLEEVPAVVVTDLSPEKIAAFRIADNKIQERSYWDNELLGEELKSIIDSIDMTELGFGDFEITMLTEDFDPEPYDSEVEKEYSGKEEEYLAKKRVIITYTDQDTQKLKRILGVEEISKVVYDIAEIK